MITPGTNLSAQGDALPNTALFNPFQTNSSIRQPPPSLQMPLNQGQNPSGFCPAGSYPFLYPPFMAALAAQSNAAAVQGGQGPRFCIPQPSPGAGAAATLRGTALLSAPSGLQGTAPPQQAGAAAPGTLPYYPGLHMAPAFPGTGAPSFAPHSTSLNQQHGGGFLSPTFRAYDSLKHFGALPQATV